MKNIATHSPRCASGVRFTKSIAAAVFLTAASLPTSAATIVSAGYIQGETEWFTAGYGSVGYAFFSATETSIQGGELDSGSIGLARNATTAADARFPLDSQSLENPLGGTFVSGTWFTAGLNNDNLVDVATLAFGAGSPDSVRIGILLGASSMAGVTPTSVPPSDFPRTVAINGVIQSVAQPPSDVELTRADWYFFDITGIEENDTFTISASRIADVANHRFNAINGIALGVIPEPSAALLGGIGFLLLLGRRR